MIWITIAFLSFVGNGFIFIGSAHQVYTRGNLYDHGVPMSLGQTCSFFGWLLCNMVVAAYVIDSLAGFE